MRSTHYKLLRVECLAVAADENDLDWVNENLAALVSQAEELISDALPEGWYAKIEDQEPERRET